MSADEKRIREFAYQIWESEGRPEGEKERHWKMARKLAEAEALAPDKSTARKAAKPKLPKVNGVAEPKASAAKAKSAESKPTASKPAAVKEAASKPATKAPAAPAAKSAAKSAAGKSKPAAATTQTEQPSSKPAAKKTRKPSAT
jgi:hypothetical protein